MIFMVNVGEKIRKLFANFHSREMRNSSSFFNGKSEISIYDGTISQQ